MKLSGGTPSWFIRYKDQGIVTIGGTPGASSRHPSVTRHPGWEPLVYVLQQEEVLCLDFDKKETSIIIVEFYNNGCNCRWS